MNGGGTRLGFGLLLGACLLALLAFDGQKGPADALPPETCGVQQPWVCVNGVPFCPATSVCPTEMAGTPDPSTTAPQPAIVTVPNTDTTGPATTTAKPRPNSEAEAKPTDAPVEAPATDPPATEPPATQPPATAPAQTATTAPRPSHGACAQTVTVAKGESWSLLARRYGVSAVSLAGANGTTIDGALWPGDVLCLPGGASATTTTSSTTTTTTTTTVAPTTAPRSAERSTTTTTNPRQRRTTTTTAAPRPTTTVAKISQEAPKQPQSPPVIVATTTTVKCSVC